MKLPGWLFALVGAVVMGYSKYIETRRDTNLTIFFWVGVAFLAFGLLKEVITRLRRKPKKEEDPVGPPPRREPQHDQRHPAGTQFHGQSPYATHQHTNPTGHVHQSHPHQAAHKQCPSCRSTNVAQARFCHACGFRF